MQIYLVFRRFYHRSSLWPLLRGKANRDSVMLFLSNLLECSRTTNSHTTDIIKKVSQPSASSLE